MLKLVDVDSVVLSVLGGGLDGDYNGDGFVTAADYTVWRDNLGAGDESSLNGNGDGMNGVDLGDYALWKTNFGAPNGSGSLTSLAAVPEPGAMALAVGLSCLGWVTWRTPRRSRKA